MALEQQQQQQETLTDALAERDDALKVALLKSLQLDCSYRICRGCNYVTISAVIAVDAAAKRGV